MAWPSGSKAGTTNVDAGSDKPALARADIKQNIDNVNSIIDTFDIASPNNGDILVYNSTSGAWEPGAPSSGGPNISLLTSNGTYDTGIATYYRHNITFSETSDLDSIVSVDGTTGVFTLGAGRYLLQVQFGQNSGTQRDFDFKDVTGGGSLKITTWVNGVMESVPLNLIVAPTGSNSYRLVASAAFTATNEIQIIITKF